MTAHKLKLSLIRKGPVSSFGFITAKNCVPSSTATKDTGQKEQAVRCEICADQR